MGDDEGEEKLLFELASASRLAILRILQGESLKMQEIARRVDITPTEAFRQLDRLSAALLVQRKSDGTFTLTEYGKLVLQLSSPLEFISKHRDYFSTHQVTHLPPQLLNRLSELSQADLSTDTIENLNKAERALVEAEQFGWGVGEGTAPEHMGPTMVERIRKGVKFRFLVPESRLSSTASTPSEIAKSLEARGLSNLPVLLVITEKEGGVFFPQIGGKFDYAGFYGKDPTFLNWIKDLFMFYWNVAKRV